MQAVVENTERVGKSTIYLGMAESLYDSWPEPTCIVVDGPYGQSGYPGDLNTVEELASWYKPHAEIWGKRSTPQTTLWFWCSELGWATVHPVLVECGWDYRSCHIWDKGIGHIAGNANSKTLRKFPVTTEVCVQYVRRAEFVTREGQVLNMQQWLRHEWARTGLTYSLANEACGVANAASRKYLTPDHLWYFPPPEAFAKLSKYAAIHGRPSGRPYFSIDGKKSLSGQEWGRMRSKFECMVGVSNVWRQAHLSGQERINGDRQSMRWKYKSLHGSQKPLNLVERIIKATTERGDVVWEPFGGLCPAAVVSLTLDRECHSAEIVSEFYDAAICRLQNADNRT